MAGDIGTTAANNTLGVNGMVQVPLNLGFAETQDLLFHLSHFNTTKLNSNLLGEFKNLLALIQVLSAFVFKYGLITSTPDTDERRRFAQQSHEYLIEQVQRQTQAGAASMRLNFNHPVKELIWTSNQVYTDLRLTLNGHDRFAKQDEEYFHLDNHTITTQACSSPEFTRFAACIIFVIR